MTKTSHKGKRSVCSEKSEGLPEVIRRRMRSRDVMKTGKVLTKRMQKKKKRK